MEEGVWIRRVFATTRFGLVCMMEKSQNPEPPGYVTFCSLRDDHSEFQFLRRSSGLRSTSRT